MNSLILIICRWGEINHPDKSFSSDAIIGAIGAIIGSIIVAIVTIWAVNLSFEKQNKKEALVLRRQRIQKIKYLQTLNNRIIKCIDFLTVNLKTFSNDLKENPFYFAPMIKVPMYDLERIVKKINQEEFYHAYIEEFNLNQAEADEFLKIYTTYDTFYGNFDLVDIRLNDVDKVNEEKRKEFEKIVDDSMVELNKYRLGSEFLYHFNLSFKINEIIENYIKSRKIKDDLPNMYENYVLKMLVGIFPFLKDMKDLQPIFIKLQDAEKVYNYLKSYDIFIANEFLYKVDIFEKELIKLKQNSKRLIEYKSDFYG